MSIQNFDDIEKHFDEMKNASSLLTSCTTDMDEKELGEKSKNVVTKRRCYGSKSSSWLDHATLLTSQAALLTANFMAHHLTGPRRPSWPVQVTLMSTFMRNLKSHTHLADIKLLRLFTGLTNPLLPSDMIITPVSFKVYNRGLEGIFSELDQQENGSREIDGEWVVQKSVLSKINQEFHLNSANAKHFWIDENGVKWSNEKVILAIHGGAYYVMSTKTHRDLNYRLSKATGRRVFAINYRLAPEGPFPCGLHDVVHAFLYLTDPNGLAIPPQNIVVAGDSAGGGLTLALLLYLRDYKLSPPGGALLFSPWVDLTMSRSSWERNRPYDILIKLNDDDPLQPVRLYLHPFEERSHLLTHPYVSPLFADLGHLPPLLIQCGDSEVLTDEIIELGNKAKATGTTCVQQEIYEDMIHVFQTFNFLEPAQKAVNAAGYWVKNVLPVHQRNSGLMRSQPQPRSFSMPIIGEADSYDNDDLRSSQSSPTLSTKKDYGSFERIVMSPEPLDSTNEENYLSSMIFYNPSEPIPTKCDKATCTYDDGVSSQKIEPSDDAGSRTIPNHSSSFSSAQYRPRRRVRSTSQPDLRQIPTTYIENCILKHYTKMGVDAGHTDKLPETDGQVDRTPKTVNVGCRNS